ncbi:hypothetical protein R6U77_07905 [Lysinibacillus louembei]|uniref:Uncharacterized protein n=1 Tax=Lysinibacillus louembei TaxID=1470088 RepID=A0ABZ0S2X3_9BACI|nr:hypothetical protein [Lysinibacillus louembei]WPK13580.1 hypothetical protein R6U77_07905 [Lysinibacillus louembei]
MAEKRIIDIRLFEELENTRSFPDYAGKIYAIEKEVHLICTRFARKLREQNFITGEFDHVYIVMTPLLGEQVVREAERQIDKRVKCYYVGVAIDSFNYKSVKEKEVYILELVAKVLLEIAHNAEQADLVISTHQLLLQLGSEVEITHLTKETKKYKIMITYQIHPNNAKSKAIIEYHDLQQAVKRKKAFLELNMYEDIYFLASTVMLQKDMICIKPKTSETARYHTKDYVTPINLAIEEIPYME